MSQAEFKKRLKALMVKPENQICSDCPERQPRWASLIVPPPGSPPGSLAFGAFTCLECSGSHRRLGVHITFVRSITLDSWKEKEVLAMENGGNAKVNAIFEAHLNNPAAKPTTGASGPVRERYIRDKYERRKYYDPSVMQSYAGGDSDDSSSSGSSSGAGPSPPRRQSSVRAPSEAARLRAQARKPKLPVPSSSIPKSRSVPVHSHSAIRTRASTSTASPPEVDLLDFNAPLAGVSTNSGPPLQPPSANPSPTFDMFKNMKELSIHGQQSPSTSTSNNGVTRSATMPVRTGNNHNLAPQMDSKKMTSDDILAMFHTPSTSQQANFASFGHMNNNNMNMNTMNNSNQMMMSNNSMMNSNNNSNMGNMNMNNNMMNNNMNNMNGGMMGGNSYGMQRQQQQRNMMSMSGSSSSSIQNNGMGGMQGQGQMNFNNTMMPMGGAPSNMNTMGGSGMGQYNQGNQNSMGMGMGMGGTNNNIDNRNGGQGGQGQGYGNVMGGSTSQQSNQFASFGSFR